MRRRFRVVLVRVDHTLRLQKIQRDPVVRTECTFHGLQRVRSFSSAERLAMNTGLSHVILRLSPPTPSILSLLLACLGRCRERTQCNSCAQLRGVLQHAHMKRRFGENFRTSNLRDPTKASPPRDAHRRSENRFLGELLSPQSSQSAG